MTLAAEGGPGYFFITFSPSPRPCPFPAGGAAPFSTFPAERVNANSNALPANKISVHPSVLNAPERSRLAFTRSIAFNAGTER
jgi:hypothetical protein